MGMMRTFKAMVATAKEFGSSYVTILFDNGKYSELSIERISNMKELSETELRFFYDKDENSQTITVIDFSKVTEIVCE